MTARKTCRTCLIIICILILALVSCGALEPSAEPAEATPYGQFEETEPVQSSWEDGETQAKVPTREDVATEDDVIRLAKTVVEEAGGIYDATEQASVVWCVLNRCDAWGISISAAAVEGQFAYCSWQSTTDGYGRDLIELVEEVLTEWAMEKAGCDCERTLPADYIYFYGDGSHNWFSNSYPVNGGILYD